MPRAKAIHTMVNEVFDKELEGQLENLKLDTANIIGKMTVNTNDGN